MTCLPAATASERATSRHVSHSHCDCISRKAPACQCDELSSRSIARQPLGTLRGRRLSSEPTQRVLACTRKASAGAVQSGHGACVAVHDVSSTAASTGCAGRAGGDVGGGAVGGSKGGAAGAVVDGAGSACSSHCPHATWKKHESARPPHVLSCAHVVSTPALPQLQLLGKVTTCG